MVLMEHGTWVYMRHNPEKNEENHCACQFPEWVATKLIQNGDYMVKTMSAFYLASFDSPFFQVVYRLPRRQSNLKTLLGILNLGNLPFRQFAILSACHFANLPFHHRTPNLVQQANGTDRTAHIRHLCQKITVMS